MRGKSPLWRTNVAPLRLFPSATRWVTVEVFHGGQIADEPFRPARHIGGFRTGTQGEDMPC